MGFWRAGFAGLGVLLCAAAGPALAEAREVGEYISFYYQAPAPEEAPEVIGALLDSEILNSKAAVESDFRGTTAYFFGRIGQMNPEIKVFYRALFEKSADKSFLVHIFRYCADEEDRKYLLAKVKDPGFEEPAEMVNGLFGSGLTEPVNLPERDIKRSGDLDYYWNEFFLTGSEQVLEKLLNVISWPDRTRAKVESYLNGSAAPENKEKVRQMLRTEFDFHFGKGGEILSKDDLDSKLALAVTTQGKGKEFQELNNLLGFTDEDTLHYATKGAVAWALASNALQHEKVLRFLEKKIPDLTGGALLLALQTAGEAELERNEDAAAEKHIRKVIELNPTDLRALEYLHLIYVKRDDDEGASDVNAKIKALEA